MNALYALGALIVKLQLGKTKYAIYRRTNQGKTKALESIDFVIILLFPVLVSLAFIDRTPESVQKLIFFIMIGAVIALLAVAAVVARRIIEKIPPEKLTAENFGNVTYSRYLEKPGSADRFKELFPCGLSQAVEAAKTVAAKLGSGDPLTMNDEQIHKCFEIYEAVYFKDQRSLEALVPDKELAAEIKAYCQKEQSKAPSAGESTVA